MGSFTGLEEKGTWEDNVGYDLLSSMGWQFSFDTPINTILLLFIAYTAHHVVYPSISQHDDPPPNDYKKSYTWMPTLHPPTILFTTYTPKSLVKFNGSEKDGAGGKILLAIKGKVFDVTAGRGFYGPGGMYGNFAGRDASRGMAKQSFDEDMLTPIDQPIDKLDDLTPDEMENMNGWIEHFSSKYPICGELVGNPE